MPSDPQASADATPSNSSAGPPSPAPSFASLARRISAWTTNSLLSLILLVAALGFGREVIRWWQSEHVEPTAQRLMVPGGADDADLPRVIEFGAFPGALGRQSFQGDRKAALVALRGMCRETTRVAALPRTPSTEAERRFLDRMAKTVPVERDPGHWQVYQLDAGLPMAAGVRLDVAKDGTPVAPTACRVVTWGMAIPVTDRAWTLYVFSPGSPSIDGGGAKEIPIPPGSERLLSIQVAGGGRMISFKGRATPDSWTRFYDTWLLANQWQPHGDWHHSGSTWGRHCESKAAAGGTLDLELVENGPGQLTGLMLIALAPDEKQHP